VAPMMAAARAGKVGAVRAVFPRGEGTGLGAGVIVRVAPGRDGSSSDRGRRPELAGG